MKENTELIHLDGYYYKINGKTVKTVNPPMYSGSTLLFDRYEDFLLARSGRYPGVTYGTDRLPNQRAFEEGLRRLEGGHLARAFPSGINAIINA